MNTHTKIVFGQIQVLHITCFTLLQ